MIFIVINVIMFKCKFIDFCCLVYAFRFTNQYDNKS